MYQAIIVDNPTAEALQYISELESMQLGKRIYSFGAIVIITRLHVDNKKCELEAIYSLGLDSLSNFLEKCILSEDYV